MPDIRVGKEYEKAFQSICRLVEEQLIDKKIILYASFQDREIIEQNTNNRFIFDPQIQSIENEKEMGMLGDGASWFKSFREGAVDDGNASWLNLIENVAGNYHEQYSFVEFKHQNIEISEERVKTHKEIIDKFTKLFLKNFKTYEIVRDKRINNDDIYVVSLKIEIDGGTGESEPLLCKIYFRKNKNKFYPILSEDAKFLGEKLFNVIIEDNDKNSNFLENDSQYENGLVIDSVLNEVEKLIENKGFSDSVVLNSVEDNVIIDKIISKSADDITEIKCRSVNVYGIAHVSFDNITYYLKSKNRNLLKFNFNVSNNMSVYCLNCGEEILIDNNRFLIKKNKEEVQKLDIDDSDLGYSEAMLRSIKENTIFAEHLISVTCKRNGKLCSKINCASDLVFLSENDEEIKCKGCPYPEILMLDEENNYRLTKDLTYVNDLHRFVSQNVPTVKCNCCGRVFTAEATKNGRCKLCSNLSSKISNDQRIKAQELYMQYKDMLPLSIRLTTSNQEKYCFEDDSLILFKLADNKAYLFNKMDIKFNGLMPNPVKIKEEK